MGSEESWLHFAQQFKTEVAKREAGDDTLRGNDAGGMGRFSEALPYDAEKNQTA